MINVKTQGFEFQQLKKLIAHIESISPIHNPPFDYYHYFHSLIEQASADIYYLAHESNHIHGLCIVNTLDIQYGQLIIHCLDELDEVKLIKELCQKNIFKDITLELIQFRSTFLVRDTLIQEGFSEKERVKMIHKNLADFASTTLPKPFSLHPITKDNCNVSGNISYQAHKKRLHIEKYHNYYSSESRSHFSLDLQNPEYNTYINEASNLLFLDRKCIGLVESIMMHYDNEYIPWIADIVIVPTHQGKKLGQMLLEHTLSTFFSMGFEKTGLSVTRSNQTALNLYTKLGYLEQENFVEILCYTQ